MAYLQFEQAAIEERGGLHTAMEIEGQPLLWQEVFNLIVYRKKEIAAFLNPVLAMPGLRIVLTGAGSSAFIGETAQGIIQEHTKKITTAIATTDIITHPQLHFIRSIPTLMVSFARSGNSPESLAAIELANECCDTVYHLVITCNQQGALVQNVMPNAYYMVLPEKANDKSLAMTGSFTAMLLCVLVMTKINVIDALRPALITLIQNAGELLEKYSGLIKYVAEQPYKRIIFLGSGPLLGIARECHLKVQELTDGQVVCKHDSFLGFRHGPRAVLNEESLIVYLFSNDENVFLYERDLCLSIDEDARNIPTVCYGRSVDGVKNDVLSISFAKPATEAGYFDCIGAVLTGQLLGFYHSLYLGLQPDNPSVSGAISRVVQGVTIYAHHEIV